MSLPDPLAMLGIRAWVLFKFLLYQLVPYLGYTEIKEYIISNRFLKLSAYFLPQKGGVTAAVGMNSHCVRSRFGLLVCSNDEAVIDEYFPVGIVAPDAHCALSSTFWSLSMLQQSSATANWYISLLAFLLWAYILPPVSATGAFRG